MSSGVVLACLALGLAACQPFAPKAPPEVPVPDTSTQEPVPEPETPPSPALPQTPPGEQPARQEIVELGHGEFLGQAPAYPEAGGGAAGDVTLNFHDTDLREFIKAMLGNVLGENYIIDPAVSGKVTLETSTPISKADLLPLIEEVLSINKAAIVKADGTYRIFPKAQPGRGYLPPEVAGREQRAGYGVRIIPLQYIAAPEMQKILEPLLGEGAQVRIDRKRNLVIVSASRPEIETAQETVDVFDVDWLRGMSVGLYPLDYVDPKTLKEELDTILGAMDPDAETGLVGNVLRAVPIERLSSILLISTTTHGLREAELWLHRLDRPGEHAGKQLHVYNVQNSKAIEIAEVLGNIFGKATITSREEPPPARLAPGMVPVQIGGEEETPAEAAPPPPARPSTVTVEPSGGGVTLPSGQSVEIIADDVRNALVVLATPQDYKMVEAAIQRLDVVPLQVLIEASIIEVTLRDDLAYGVEWFFKNNFQQGGGKEGRGVLDLGDTGIGPVFPGFAYTIVDNADQVRIALNALAQESEVNVLSSPTLMVLDNQTAMINVGDEIPVPTRQSVSVIDPQAPTINEIEFRQTGVTLTVTPRVNNSGLVNMEIRQEVSNAVNTTSSNIDAPTIQQRQIESTVAINSGETIVLGGLIQDTRSNSESGIPYLHRIPLLGKLFGQTRDENRRTELLVLITPRVVRNRNEARDITDEFRRKLRGLAPG